MRFIQYDIEAFYPNISKALLMKAINYAKSVTEVTNEEVEIIIHSRRTVLASEDGDVWMKKKSSEFYVGVGAFDGAEVAEMVGLLMLHKLEEIMDKKDSGLYRDDGLLVVEGGGQESERIK